MGVIHRERANFQVSTATPRGAYGVRGVRRRRQLSLIPTWSHATCTCHFSRSWQRWCTRPNGENTVQNPRPGGDLRDFRSSRAVPPGGQAPGRPGCLVTGTVRARRGAVATPAAAARGGASRTNPRTPLSNLVLYALDAQTAEAYSTRRSYGGYSTASGVSGNVSSDVGMPASTVR